MSAQSSGSSGKRRGRDDFGGGLSRQSRADRTALLARYAPPAAAIAYAAASSLMFQVCRGTVSHSVERYAIQNGEGFRGCYTCFFCSMIASMFLTEFWAFLAILTAQASDLPSFAASLKTV